MKVIEFNARIMKIMKIIGFNENHKIPHEIRKTNEDLRIQSENNENHFKNTTFHKRIMKIMKLLEFHAIINKFMKIIEFH